MCRVYLNLSVAMEVQESWAITTTDGVEMVDVVVDYGEQVAVEYFF